MEPRSAERRSPALRLWASLALLALGCSSESTAGGYFDARGEVFLSPQFTAAQCEVIEGALSEWSQATNEEVAFRLRIGDGYPRISPAPMGTRILGEFVPSARPEIVLDTQKALEPGSLRNLTLHEVGHALGLAHIDRNESVMFPFATTVQALDEWTLAAWRERRDTAP